MPDFRLARQYHNLAQTMSSISLRPEYVLNVLCTLSPRHDCHLALLVEEILLIIFEFAMGELDGDRTMAAAALVCRAWRYPASDVLWRDVPSTSVLSLLAPLILVRDGMARLLSQIF